MANKPRAAGSIKLVPSKAVHGESPDGIDSSRRRAGHWVSVEDGRVVVDGEQRAKLAARVIQWDADERRVVAAVDAGTYGSIVEVDITGGAPRTVFEQTVHRDAVSKLASVALGPGGEIVTGSMYHLMLLGTDGQIAHELKEDAVTLWRVSNVLLVEHYKRNKVVYRIEKGKLARGEKITSKDTIYAAWTEDGRWFAEVDDGTVEVIGC